MDHSITQHIPHTATTMASKSATRCLSKVLSRPTLTSSATTRTQRLAATTTARSFSHTPIETSLSPSARRQRPAAQHIRTPLLRQPQAKRTIFIQTEDTPNADALKFRPNHEILPEDFPSSFLEYLTPRSTLAAPHPSPLAANLLNVDGITSVFYGRDYITVTKDSSTPWPHVKPEVFALITEAVTNGQPIVNTVAQKDGEEHGQGGFADAAQYDPKDEEVVGMIEELLETRIRPAIQEDGGDIEFRGFVDGQVLLKLRGACRTCDSSTVTLKNGIESMLMHYIEEVKGVQQVMDQEEEVAMKEFEKFEEKLKAQREADAGAAASTTGKSSTDEVLGLNK
jgi:Fe-S cluster biogenesis protein NfuA